MTNGPDGRSTDVEGELHRRYTQAFEQYANLTRAFMNQWQAGAASPATPSAGASAAGNATDITRTLSDWFQKSILGTAADPAAAWARFAGAMAPASGAAAGANPLEHLLRQQEAITRRLFELGAQCQRLQGQLGQHWAAVGQDAAQRFLGSMQGGAAPAGDPAQWTQKLYSAWIDNAEKAYREAARGADYVNLLASLTNAANAFKSEQNALVELWAKFFDHPTRRELDELHQEVRDLREELRKLSRTAGR